MSKRRQNRHEQARSVRGLAAIEGLEDDGRHRPMWATSAREC